MFCTFFQELWPFVFGKRANILLHVNNVWTSEACNLIQSSSQRSGWLQYTFRTGWGGVRYIRRVREQHRMGLLSSLSALLLLLCDYNQSHYCFHVHAGKDKVRSRGIVSLDITGLWLKVAGFKAERIISLTSAFILSVRQLSSKISRHYWLDCNWRRYDCGGVM